MKVSKAIWMAAKSNAAWRRNIGDQWAIRALSWFWFCFYVFRAIRFGLLFTGREQLGSRVLYKGEPATVSNWAGQPCVSLCVGDHYVRHAMREDIQQQVNLRELLHRFRSGVSFYTTNWMQIDINRRLYPDLKKAMILLLLAIPSCCQETCQAQSIVVSGQKRSIVVSGLGHAPAPVSQPVIANPAPVVTSNAPTNAPVDAGAAGEVFVTTVQERYLVSEPWCGYCGPAKARFLASGGKPENIISIAQAKAMGHRWGGGVPHEFTMQQAVEVKKQPSIETQRGTARNTADQPSNYTEAQRQADIEHLLTHRSHAGKFTREYLETLSGYQLIDLHNTDHGVPTVKGQKVGRTVAQPATRQRLPVVNTQWGTIDLETYNRPRCNCPMCQGIRALQQQYRQTSLERPLPAAQEPTPDDVLPQVIDALQLTSQDKLADIGCGDGRILIAAVERYGCNGIGIEIDPVRAELARQNVEQAGLSTKIEIVTGDALRFWPADHGVTAAVAYLYPDLLSQLRPQLEQVRVLVTPFHQVPGLAMVQRGDVWVRRI